MINIKPEIKILYTTKGLYLDENGIKNSYFFEGKYKNKTIVKNHIFNHKLFKKWLEEQKFSLFMKNIIFYIYPDTLSLEIEFLEQIFKEQLIKKIVFKQLFNHFTTEFLMFSTSDCFYLIYPITSRKKCQIKTTKKDVLNSLTKMKISKVKIYGDKLNLNKLELQIEKLTKIPAYYQENIFKLIEST